MSVRRLLPLLGLLLVAFAAHAIDPLPFRDQAQRERFQHLTRELRCLVCQNESLADSNADLARDLRHEVFQLMQQGKSDEQIKQYLVARYSDYVLYDPPLRPSTWLLWFGPAAVLLLGALAVVLTVRRRGRGSTGSPPVADEDDW